jgi:hypothetical protein
MMWERDRALIGNSGVMRTLAAGEEALAASRTGITEFLAIREKYLIYH